MLKCPVCKQNNVTVVDSKRVPGSQVQGGRIAIYYSTTRRCHSCGFTWNKLETVSETVRVRLW